MPVTDRRRGQRPHAKATAVTNRRSDVNVSVWLKADDFAQLDAIARASDISRSALVREVIHQFFAAQRGQQ